jgi:hypothetical protein
VNRHNSKQGYNLDELLNESKPTHGLASHTRNLGSCESLLALWWVSFRSDIAMLRKRSATSPK